MGLRNSYCHLFFCTHTRLKTSSPPGVALGSDLSHGQNATLRTLPPPRIWPWVRSTFSCLALDGFPRRCPLAQWASAGRQHMAVFSDLFSSFGIQKSCPLQPPLLPSSRETTSEHANSCLLPLNLGASEQLHLVCPLAEKGQQSRAELPPPARLCPNLQHLTELQAG